MIFSKNLLMEEIETYYTLTITSTDPVINQSTVTCVLSYDGQNHTATTATVKAGTVITYTLTDTTHNNDGSYVTKSANVTMNSDITLNCSVQVSTSDVSWSQPVITTSSGSSTTINTMGGNDFAIQVGRTRSGNAYQVSNAFDGILPTSGRVGTNYYCMGIINVSGEGNNCWCKVYNPVPIKPSKFNIYWNASGSASHTEVIEISASNDDSSYTTLVSNQQNTSGSWNYADMSNHQITINTNNYYKYFKINNSSPESGYWYVVELEITATYKKNTYYWNVV